MKTKQIIIIADIPRKGQEPIKEMIGQKFPVHTFYEENKTVQINAEPFEGLIMLNPGEYKFV